MPFELPRVGSWDIPDRRPTSPGAAGGDSMLARMATEAPRVPWDVFISGHFAWGFGEHVGMIGPTGQGKTTLLTQLLPLHPYVAVFATKPRDDTMDQLIASGYQRMQQWESIPAARVPRRVLWPSARELGSEDTQRDVFDNAFQRIYREGAWTVAIDELWYFTNVLGLGKHVKTYLLQARSLDISLVVATQRPAWVPLEVFDQSTHLFFWRDNDETNLRRISGISYRSAELVRTIVSNLDRYQVLYVNTRTGRMLRTKAPAPQLHAVKGG